MPRPRARSRNRPDALEAPAGEPEAAVGSLLGDAGRRKLSAGEADVGASRERIRRNRLTRLALVLCVPLGWLWFRLLEGSGFDILGLSVPSIDPLLLMPALFFLALILLLVGTTVGAGRSPHVTYRPEQIAVRLDDVVGIDVVKDEVVRSLNLFLAHKTFADEMGGTPRRRSALRGRARAPARPTSPRRWRARPGCRSCSCPRRAFQSMYYGATARKIRSYFKALRKAARQEGGAIGVHRGDRRDRAGARRLWR